MSGERLLLLEPIGGVAGDMFLAAALELGVDRAALERGLSGLGVTGFRLEVSRAERHSLTGTHLDVVVDGEQPHHRALSDIQRLIEGAATMPERAKQRALEVFRLIGEAEARIHGVPLERIHFHEVGAVDSIVDICGAALVLELLGNPTVYSLPPPLGSGQVKTAHGMMPVPAPATLEILKDVPVRFEGVGELTTPTGAALLKAFARIGPLPTQLRVERVGYGVGTKDFKDRPNVLRASLAETVATAGAGSYSGSASDGMYVVEANLDDCPPQWLGNLVERLLAVGAVDAYVAPLTMKKSRPGHLLGAVVPGEARERVVETMLRESTTLGVRFHRVERVELERRFVEVETPYGKVRMKEGLLRGEPVNAHPEYEDCRALAEKAGVPLKNVWMAAVAAHARSSRGSPEPSRGA